MHDKNNPGPDTSLVIEENKTIPSYNVSCDLDVIAASFWEESHNGDVIFKAGDEEMLFIGLHPEQRNLSVRNSVFERGYLKGTFQLVDVTYPDADEYDEREYGFHFTSSSFVLKCGNTVSNNDYPSETPK